MIEIAQEAIDEVEGSLEYKEIYLKVIREHMENLESYKIACAIFNQTPANFFQIGFDTCFSIIIDLIENTKIIH